MAEWVRVAGTSEIPAGASRLVEVGDRQIALFNVGGHFHAIDNVCQHQGGPLAEGEVDAGVVTCPWHGWTYDVTTGVSPDDPGVRVQSFAVRIDGDSVLVDLASPGML